MRRKKTGHSVLVFFILNRKRVNIQSEWFTASSNWKLRKGVCLESVKKLSSAEMKKKVHLCNLVLTSSFRKNENENELPTVGISGLKMCPQERIYPSPKKKILAFKQRKLRLAKKKWLTVSRLHNSSLPIFLSTISHWKSLLIAPITLTSLTYRNGRSRFGSWGDAYAADCHVWVFWKLDNSKELRFVGMREWRRSDFAFLFVLVT